MLFLDVRLVFLVIVVLRFAGEAIRPHFGVGSSKVFHVGMFVLCLLETHHASKYAGVRTVSRWQGAFPVGGIVFVAAVREGVTYAGPVPSGSRSDAFARVATVDFMRGVITVGVLRWLYSTCGHIRDCDSVSTEYSTTVTGQ